MVKKLRSENIPVISEIELAYRYKGNSRIIGITGSNGKTTTTAMSLSYLQTHAGLNCALVGNIGDSFAKAGCRRTEKTGTHRRDQQLPVG